MRKVKYILYIIAGVLLTLAPSTTSALTEQSEVDVQFTFNPFLTVSLSSGDIVIPNLVPGTAANSNTVNIVVSTNNVTGYNLSATVGNTTKDTRNLVHTNGTNAFSSIDVGTSATTLTTDNTWGYSIDAGSHYSGLPIYSATNGAELKNTSAPAADDTTAFLIGAKAASSQVAGDYTNVINFTAVTNVLPAKYVMQDLDPALCTATAPITVIDSRDGQEYLIQKLADGKCWLLDNLRLDLTNSTIRNALTASNTNATETSLTSLRSGNRTAGIQYASSGFATWNSSSPDFAWNQAKANADYKETINENASFNYGPGSHKYGVYYNYCAASAGSLCNDYGIGIGDVDVSQDICPAGWRMPTGGYSSGEYLALYTAYSSNVTNFQNALSTPLSGYFGSGSAVNQGSEGVFWSATYSSVYHMYRLSVTSSSVDPRRITQREYGLSVRCVFGT